MSIMREMVNDVHDRCIAYNVNMCCEVYDGQFLNFVCYSEDGTRLTRFAFLQWFFKQIQGWTKPQCVNYLVTDTIPNGVPLEVLITPDKVNLWKKHVEQVSRRRENRPASSGTNIHTQDQDDVTNLLQGSQLGSRLQRQVRDANSDEDSDDIYFNSDESSDMEDELEDILADVQELQPADQGTTFLEDLLQRLRRNKSGKINWLVLDVDDLVNDYLRKPMQCMKLVHDELNIISNLIQTYTGVKVFRMSDTKPVKINKLITNFRMSSQQLVTTTRKKYKVQTLQYWAQVKLMDPLYPKIYLQIVVANAILETNARQWLQSSTVPMTVNVPQDEYGEWHLSHECHSYPEWNEDRKQFEFRCIDPGHTLANMRSQISCYGYEFC